MTGPALVVTTTSCNSGSWAAGSPPTPAVLRAPLAEGHLQGPLQCLMPRQVGDELAMVTQPGWSRQEAQPRPLDFWGSTPSLPSRAFRAVHTDTLEPRGPAGRPMSKNWPQI